jgi:hypothetical protein
MEKIALSGGYPQWDSLRKGWHRLQSVPQPIPATAGPAKRHHTMLEPLKHGKLLPNRIRQMKHTQNTALSKAPRKKSKNNAQKKPLAGNRERAAMLLEDGPSGGSSGKRRANREIGVPGRKALRYSWRRATMGSTLMAFRVGM